MPANHVQWAVQYPVSADIAALGTVHCCVEIRCDAKAQSGNACVVGLYDAEAKTSVVQRVLTIQETRDKYALIDLGVHQLKNGMYVWVAPMNNPAAVDTVFVDRLFFMR
jgi:hypothetical protein